MHQFHPTILREYDIRGIVGETLSVDDARAIGGLSEPWRGKKTLAEEFASGVTGDCHRRIWKPRWSRACWRLG